MHELRSYFSCYIVKVLLLCSHKGIGDTVDSKPRFNSFWGEESFEKIALKTGNHLNKAIFFT